jgi:hypothetical protein
MMGQQRRPRIALNLALGLAVGLVAGAGGCATPRIGASGKLAGYELHSPVDSEAARRYLTGEPLPPPLEAVRRQLLASDQAPAREVLAAVARDYSPDVATLLFLEAVGSRRDTCELRRQYEVELAHIRRVGVDAAGPELPQDVLVLMVPGWFYVAHGGETNADYRIQRSLFERWGIPHRLVPVDENGTVEDNARIVAAAIREATKTHRVFLVSASKSGAEVAQAIGRELKPSETEAVVGWLSIVGVARGTPYADRALARDVRWLVKLKLASERFDLAGLKSMRVSRERHAFNERAFPPHIRTIACIAVPLSGQITQRASLGYRVMRDFGPNDGLTLLTDELFPGAVPFLLPGIDHFLGSPEQQAIWSTALLRLLAAELTGPATSASSAPPVREERNRNAT